MEGQFIIKRIVRGTPDVERVLADGAYDGALCVEGPQLNGRHILDPVLRIEAATTQIYDRQGGALVVTFAISKTHSTLTKSFHHWTRHFELVRGIADLEITLTEGSNTNVWLAANCGWETVEIPAPDGVGTLTSYRVLVPKFLCETLDDDGNGTESALLNEDNTPLTNENTTPLTNET